MSPPNETELADTVRGAWHTFLTTYGPLRSELYRFCRHLTRSPWDAEDLAQDTLARAFVTLGHMIEPPRNPRAWLFRVASHLWIDLVRRRRTVSQTVEGETPPADTVATREAAGTLLVQLAPQERAAVVLRDVFDFSLDEIAEALSTTTGAVKAALHRGRGKLVDPDQDETRAPAPGVLDAWCTAFNAGDLEGLTALLLDNASVTVVGATTVYGPEMARRTVLPGMLWGVKRIADGTGVEKQYIQGVRVEPVRVELRAHRGEWLLLGFYAHDDGEHVRAVTRVEIEGDRIASMKNYFYTPDFLAEICGELGESCRVNGHHWFLRLPS